MIDANAPVGPTAVFGGTFDPIHYGHLRSALELVERLALQQLRLMPCATPVHRDSPACGALHRAAMVELAVGDEHKLVCDKRELNRPGSSYTIDSLIELRQELGSARSLSLVMGCDAVQGLTGWHRWDELLDWAHVIVIARPGWHLPTKGPVADWLQAFRIQDTQLLTENPRGGILIEELRPLAISSTEIRALLREGRSVRFLLPQAVLDYIEEHQLYTTGGHY
ncbi:MAG: nicotinate-nucleotide adenylyltransferase [Pseudomonadota bacterium]